LTINPGVVAAIHVAGVRDDPCGAMRSHCTTRVTTYMYCCRNTGIDRQDFKSVF